MIVLSLENWLHFPGFLGFFVLFCFKKQNYKVGFSVCVDVTHMTTSFGDLVKGLYDFKFFHLTGSGTIPTLCRL